MLWLIEIVTVAGGLLSWLGVMLIVIIRLALHPQQHAFCELLAQVLSFGAGLQVGTTRSAAVFTPQLAAVRSGFPGPPTLLGVSHTESSGTGEAEA